jgi:sugar-specific transcriptional regulator TrmB
MQSDILIAKLTRAGLSHKSATIYSFLIGVGGAFPSRIAEETHLNRTTVYKILTDLSIKGLVSEIEKGKKLFYQAEKPETFLRYAKGQSERAHDAFEVAKKIVPELEGLYSLNPNKPKIRFFENYEGLQAIMEDHISENEPYEMLGFANAAELESFMTEEFIKKYVKQKEKIGITTRGVVPDTRTDKTYTERMYAGIDKKFWLNLRHIPSQEFPFNGEITIYGTQKVSIVNFDKTHMVGIIIEDKAIHDMMVRIFELAWRGAEMLEKK